MLLNILMGFQSMTTCTGITQVSIYASLLMILTTLIMILYFVH